mgnify:CR=1 FL=1
MNPQKILGIAHAFLIVAALALAISIALAYPLESHLSLPALIGAHIATLITATIIKLAYIARLYALNRLGLPVD